MGRTIAVILATLVASFFVVQAAFGQPASQPADTGALQFLAGGSPLSIVVFVIVALALTKLLDAGLKEKLPKWLLPYVTMVMGIATQVATALIAGADWQRAILYGVSVGSLASWSYSAGVKKLPGVKAGER